MILSGLQAAAASLVLSSGSAPAGAQRGLTRHAAIHTDVICRERVPVARGCPVKGVKSRAATAVAILYGLSAI